MNITRLSAAIRHKLVRLVVRNLCCWPLMLASPHKAPPTHELQTPRGYDGWRGLRQHAGLRKNRNKFVLLP